VSEADARQYYQAHPKEFTTPERVQLSYLQLSGKNLRATTHFSEAELRQYYQDHIERYSGPRRYHLGEILIPVAQKASPDDVKAAQEKIVALARRAQRGDAFATLAPEHYRDYVRTAASLEPESAQVVMGLQPDAVSTPFRTSDGLHLIHLIRRSLGKPKPFASVKTQIQRGSDGSNDRAVFACRCSGIQIGGGRIPVTQRCGESSV
jgi:peptidyl-prolyl cis-trans isomerase D